MNTLEYQFAIGSTVRMKPLGRIGTVGSIHLGEDKRIQVDVKFVGADNSAQRAWFVEDQLEAVQEETGEQ